MTIDLHFAGPSTRAIVGAWWALALVFVAGCGHNGDVPAASIGASGDATVSGAGGAQAGDEDPVTLVANDGQFRSPAQSITELHPEVVIQTNLGSVRVRLNWEKAPRTVANFLYNYVETGFYDQTLIHYVEAGYLIAGGGYSAEHQLKETRPPIPCEADNGLSNARGTIAMARHPGFANSGTSQFFINLVDNPGLDYREDDPNGMNGYCVFGQVIEGMDVVDRIGELPVGAQGDLTKMPTEPVVVQSVKRVK